MPRNPHPDRVTLDTNCLSWGGAKPRHGSDRRTRDRGRVDLGGRGKRCSLPPGGSPWSQSLSAPLHSPVPLARHYERAGKDPGWSPAASRGDDRCRWMPRDARVGINGGVRAAERAAALMRYFDADADGLLSFEEFRGESAPHGNPGECWRRAPGSKRHDELRCAPRQGYTCGFAAPVGA